MFNTIAVDIISCFVVGRKFFPRCQIYVWNDFFVSARRFVCVIYKYCSFFALEDVSNLTLKGFKYELENYQLSHTSLLGVSNEAIGNCRITFSSGRLLLIKSKEM